MEVVEILKELEFAQTTYPVAAVKAAIAKRDELIPELLRIVEETTSNAQAIVDQEAAGEESYMAHLFAMFLLAQFREPRAYPLIVKFAGLPEEILDDLLGDLMTDGLDRFLASVCSGDLDPIKGLVENPELNEWVRGASLDALMQLVTVGEKSRDEILAYFQNLIHGKLECPPEEVWAHLVWCCADLHPAEVMDEIRDLYERDLVDTTCIQLQEVEKELARPREVVLAELPDKYKGLILDTVAETEAWAYLRPPVDADDDGWDDGDDFDPDEIWKREDYWKQGELVAGGGVYPFVREVPKIGRNQPCPCGSGKKYKKCCGR